MKLLAFGTRAVSVMRWAILSMSVAAGGAQAAIVTDLYSIVLELNADAQNSRADAIRRAMDQVLVRVTGSRAAATAPELETLRRDAATSYLNSYGLLPDRTVQVGFIPRNVDQALERLGWPVWGAERPSTIFWVVVENAFGERAILSSGELTNQFEHSIAMQDVLAQLRTEVENSAYARGVPYSLPAMDLTDMFSIDFADIWRHSVETIVDASRRYGADAIVIGRLQDGFLGLDAEWTLLVGSERRLLVGSGIADTVDLLADQFAAQFGVAGGIRPVEVRISGVDSVADYGRVMSYLNTISIVSRVDISDYSDGILSLEIHSRGDAGVLGRVLSLSTVVVPAAESPGAAGFFGDALNFQIRADGSDR